MSFTTILVHVQDDAEGEARVRLSASVAGRFEARLVGIAAAAVSPPLTSPYGGLLSAELIEWEEREILKSLRAAQQRFASVAETAAHEVEWIAALDLPSLVVARESRAADLVVIGRNRHSSPYRSPEPGDVLMRAGCPVLLIPPGLDSIEASSVVVAWKDTREAHRALSDALPFLQRATSVLLLAICDSQEELDSVSKRLASVGSFLGGHGVQAECESRCLREQSIADEILLAAENRRADLVVAGAYGHSRMREWVFGGVTRALVHHFPKSCLLSR